MAGTADPTQVQEELRALVAEFLYCEVSEVDVDATFTDLGLDSVLIVEFVAELNARYPVQESVDSLYLRPTVNQLAAHVLGHTAAGS